MSRLDDELKIAFKRKEPSADFAARVLERINQTPAPKKNWWQTIVALFEPPRIRWVAIGVAASLLIAIGVAQYRALDENRAEAQPGLAQANTEPEASSVDAKKDSPVVVAPDSVDKGEKRRGVAPSRRTVDKRDRVARSASNQTRLARAPKDRGVSAEAEAAKERVLFALQIVGSTLGDAQRVIQEDSGQVKPEPLNNR
jgi:negative regulator of sigma E activity